MRKFLTFASLLLLTGCGPRYCAMGVPNPFYDSRNTQPPVMFEEKVLYPDSDPDGIRPGSGAQDSAPGPQPIGPPMIVGDAGSGGHPPTQARPAAAPTHAAPMSLASRSVSSPQTYDEPEDAGYGAAPLEPEEDYVRPRARDRDRDRDRGRGRDGWRPNRPDYGRDEYVTRNPRQRDRPMYGDDHRARDRDDRPNRGRRNRDDTHADSGRGHRDDGDRRRGGRDRDDGGRRHVNRYDGPEMASASGHNARHADSPRSRRDDMNGDDSRRRARRDRRQARDDMG